MRKVLSYAFFVFRNYLISGITIPARTKHKQITYRTFQTGSFLATYFQARYATMQIITAVASPCKAETTFRLTPHSDRTIEIAYNSATATIVYIDSLFSPQANTPLFLELLLDLLLEVVVVVVVVVVSAGLVVFVPLLLAGFVVVFVVTVFFVVAITFSFCKFYFGIYEIIHIVPILVKQFDIANLWIF